MSYAYHGKILIFIEYAYIKHMFPYAEKCTRQRFVRISYLFLSSLLIDCPIWRISVFVNIFEKLLSKDTS